MNRGGAELRRWLNPRFLVLGIAVFNFVLIWSTAHTMPGACVVCPWFYPWTYFNEPTLILLAAVALCIGRRFSYGIAITMSGYLISDLLYRMWVYDFGLVQIMREFLSPYTEIVYAWQTQYVIAVGTFMVAVVCLVTDITVRGSASSGQK